LLTDEPFQNRGLIQPSLKDLFLVVVVLRLIAGIVITF